MKKIALLLALLAVPAFAQDPGGSRIIGYNPPLSAMGGIDGSGSANKVCRFLDADTIAPGQCTDDGAADLSCPGLIDTDLTASRPVLSGASKELVSGQIDLANSNHVTGILPIANHPIITQAKGGIGFAAGTPDSCTSTNVTSSVIQSNSTDFSGTCTLTGNGTNSNGVITLDFSQTAPNGWRCQWNIENVSGGGSWQGAGTVIGASRSTTVVTASWVNETFLGAATALTAATVYWVTYTCTMF